MAFHVNWSTLQEPKVHTTIEDAFDTVLQYMNVTSRQCKVRSQFFCSTFWIVYIQAYNDDVIEGLFYASKQPGCS